MRYSFLLGVVLRKWGLPPLATDPELTRGAQPLPPDNGERESAGVHRLTTRCLSHRLVTDAGEVQAMNPTEPRWAGNPELCFGLPSLCRCLPAPNPSMGPVPPHPSCAADAQAGLLRYETPAAILTLVRVGPPCPTGWEGLGA